MKNEKLITISQIYLNTE